jgi:hypothetical protein
MNWYYVDAGQQAGPVDEAGLAELVRTGKIQPETLVWHEGMQGWSAYLNVAPITPGREAGTPAPSGTPATGSTGGVTCSECGRVFAPSDVIRYEDKFVCASCKPIFFQRLREGATLAAPSTGGTATEADLLTRDYQVDIGGSLAQSWEVFKASAGMIIGASFVVVLALIASNAIPYLNLVLGLLLNGPLMGGLWLFYIKKTRGQEAGIPEAFGGFGPGFWQIVLTQIIPGLITGAFAAILAAIAVPTILLGLRQGGGSANMAPAMMALLGVLALVAVVVLTYLNVCWLFAIPLAADKGLKFWPALELSRRVVNKHWWMTFWLMMVASVLCMAGVITCCVGLLVTGPVAFGMLTSHYNRVFGDLAPSRGLI